MQDTAENLTPKGVSGQVQSVSNSAEVFPQSAQQQSALSEGALSKWPSAHEQAGQPANGLRPSAQQLEELAPAPDSLKPTWNSLEPLDTKTGRLSPGSSPKLQQEGTPTLATGQAKSERLEAQSIQADDKTSPVSEEPEGENNKDESIEAGPSGRFSAEDQVGKAVGRRTVSIRPKDWAGGVVWAKLAKYPWWPAQVLEENDPWIPNDTEVPRRGAIPVRFFGTYDFAWIESQRAICPIDQDYEEHSSKSKQKSFTDALEEAAHFQKTRELPDGFNEDTTPTPQKAPKSRKGSGKGKGKKGETPGNTGKGSKRPAEDSSAHRRSVRERQDSIMQNLALVPPLDSPYSHSINLEGVRKLMELQKAGQYPPPAPQPFPQQQQTFAPPFSAGHFSAAQYTSQQQLPTLQQQLQQQMPQVSQGRPQGWPLHFQAFNTQLPLSFFQAQGGVQGALLAAASQGQFQSKQF